MESTEQETVTAIFKEAGWTAGTRDGWDGKFVWKETNVVGGVDPWGTPRTTGIVDNPNEGPTTREDAARWLVEHARKLRLEPTPPMLDLTTEATLTPPEVVNETFPVEPEAAAIAEVEGLFPAGEAEYGGEHETHGETGEDAAPGDGLLGASAAAVETAPELDNEPDGGAGDFEYAADDASGDPEPLDADYEPFGEPEALEAEAAAEPLALPEGLELGEELEAEHPEYQGQDRFIGLDDLDRRRSLRIGDVVQLSIAKQEAVWEAFATSESEFADLQNAVMRDTVDSIYRGRPDVYERFLALSEVNRRASNIRASEHAKVAFLKDAGRAEIEAFDPEADWPE